MTRGLLQGLARYGRRHYRAIFAAAALLLAAAGFLVARLRIEGDVLKLLPKNDPVINAYLDTLDAFGTFDYLMVTLGLPEGAPLEPYESFADLLAERLAASPQIERVEYRLGEPEELLASVFPQAVLFLGPDGRAELAARLSDEAIARRAKELRRLLSTPQGVAMKRLVLLDPFGLTPLFLGRFEANQSAMAVDWASGYYLSRDHRLLLLLAKPVRPPQDIEFDRALLAETEAAVAAVAAQWGEIAGSEPPPLPVVRTGGAHVAALEDAGNIEKDMVVNIATSAALVLLLFLFAFRRFGPLAYAALPLAGGLILTFAFAGATFGVVSSATSGTAALLIGLGIDFVIVSYGRFVEERRRGEGLEGALAAMMGSSGRAVVVGGVTTAATFYAFTFTDFRGLRQMGVLTGTGILFCMAAVLLLLPAMLAWSEDHHRRRARRPTLYLHSFGTGRVVRFCLAHPRTVLAGGLAVSVAAAALALRVGFEDNWRSMRPAGNQGVEVEQLVARHFNSDFDYMMLVLSADGPEELLALTDRATARAQELVAGGVINGVASVASVIPPPAQQAETLAWLAGMRRDGVLDLDRIRARFAAALAGEGLRSAPFEAGLELFAEAVGPTGPIGVADLPRSEQAQLLLDRVLRRDGDGWKSVVYLYPPAEIWRRQAPPEAHALAADLGPGALLTGANVVNKQMRSRIKRDAWIAAALGTAVVWLLLLADFRNLRASLLALSPLGVGILWMLGAMGALGIDMNFMNIFVTTMIIGIGVDYGLHMVHRYREIRARGPHGDLEAGLVETGNALVVAALSTVAGFGSMSLSHYPGLRSTGYVAILGALATALVAVTMLPAYLSLRAGRREPAPTPLPPEA